MKKSHGILLLHQFLILKMKGFYKQNILSKNIINYFSHLYRNFEEKLKMYDNFESMSNGLDEIYLDLTAPKQQTQPNQQN